MTGKPDVTAGTPLARVLDDVVGAIERADGLDKISAAIAAVDGKILNVTWIRNLLSGTPIGHPLHPLLVAVPIGSWTAATVFDLVGDDKGAQRLIGLGVLSAVPTAAAGASDWLHTNGAEQRVGLVHALANSFTVSAYALSWWERHRGHRGRGIAWSTLGGVTLAVGGWLGGHLSYALGVGVDTTAFQHAEDEWTPTVSADQVRAGELTAADAGGVPVLLTRGSDDRVVALADRCTHRGAPLHEGHLVDGCIVCPWHGSEFALDGAVQRGPATRAQLAYEVNERDGQVLVRVVGEQRSLRTNPVGM